jgi:hypothetical protein
MKHQGPVSKLIKLIMAFAIFWMVIGDLITYHQEKIFGNNFFDTHSPFSKPKSKDDGKTGHFGHYKPADKHQTVSSYAEVVIFHSGILLFYTALRYEFELLKLHPSGTLQFTRKILRAPPVHS